MNANEVLHETFIITIFVSAMMLAVEYVNVRTQNFTSKLLGRRGITQLVLAALLGATPGCLGAFAVVALYVEGNITLGAVVAAMIATSGDESFVMFAVMPKQALWLTVGLAVIGIAAGWATDRFNRHKDSDTTCCSFPKQHAPSCQGIPPGQVLEQWRHPTRHRAILTGLLGLALYLLAVGSLGPPSWGWKRVTLMTASGVALFVVATVPDGFLREHLWRHVVMKHMPRIFLWTLGTMGFMAVAGRYLNVQTLVVNNTAAVLGLAGLVGLIPESGPHLLFVNMFAHGLVPLSVLVTSSIVQDGHGMLPLLAHSRREFFIVKGINLAVGLLVGALLLIVGT